VSAGDVLVTGDRRVHVATRSLSRSGPWHQVPHLARLDAIRVLKHPAMLVGVVWFVLGVGIENDLPSAYDRYTAATASLVLVLGIPTFVAVNMVATSGRRSGVDEWSAALPVPFLHRTVATLLAACAPALVGLVLTLGYLALTPGETLLPILWQHVAAQVAALLGAGLLGVAVARLLPWPGLPLLVAVALVTANLWVSGHWPYLGAYTEFVLGTASPDDLPARAPGSASWHLVYLVALGALAAAGALLPVARRWYLPFLVGAALGSVVLVAGWFQLP
jgi:hypothetical protein